MTVDVVLITYNQERFIAQAVESILFQRVRSDVDVRVIIADDCSVDNTLKIIKTYEQHSCFPFMFLNGQQNIGHIKNYQRAFGMCNADYTFVLEGDDYWCSPYHIVKHIDFLDEHRECSMSVNGIVLLWSKNNLYELHDYKAHSEVQYIDIRKQIICNHIGNHSSACYRTTHLKTIPLSFYGSSFDDALLGIWFAQYGFIAKLKDYTTVYRKSDKGLWSGLNTDEQSKIIIERLKKNDELFDHKYHDFFLEAINFCSDNSDSKVNILNYLPPIIIKIVKLFIPKIYKKKIV